MILDYGKAVYEGSVVLNNIGVELLERRCFEQALETLTDATQAMQSIFRSGPSVMPANILAVRSMLQKANRRKASAKTSTISPHAFRIVNLSDNCNEILHEGNSNQSRKTIYPIRIDDVSTEICSPGGLKDPDVHAAILLCNLGLANLGMAMHSLRYDSANANNNAAALQQSMSILQLAGEILEHRCAEFEDDDVALRQVVCIDMSILAGLLHAMTSCDGFFMEDIKEGFATLSAMISAAKDLDQALQIYTSDINCAPAA